MQWDLRTHVHAAVRSSILSIPDQAALLIALNGAWIRADIDAKWARRWRRMAFFNAALCLASGVLYWLRWLS